MCKLFNVLQPDRPLFDASRDNTLVCCAVRQETAHAKTYVFAPATPARFAFLPGQYVNFTFHIDDEAVERCYSISSPATNEARIAITVKRTPGGRVSNWLFDYMGVGKIVRASDFLGTFTPAGVTAEKVLLLSAGSGITPVMSMLRTLAALGADTDIVFLHYAHTFEDVIFRDELDLIGRQLPHSNVVLVLTRANASQTSTPMPGRITAERLLELVPDIASRVVFCCGPEGFMTSARAFAVGHGVASNAYFEEHFVLPPEGQPDMVPVPAGMAAQFTLRFDKLGRTISCPADMTLLKAAQLAKIPMPSSCQRGICGTCRAKIVSGTVDMNHAGGIRPRDIEKGFILPCCSRPTSDVVLEK